MSLIGSLCLLLPQAAPPQEPTPAEPVTVALEHRALRTWQIQLPEERWQSVGTAFALKQTHGFDFKTKLEGTRLLVDTDGDGVTDVTADGKTAFLTLRGKTRDGKPSSYSVRLANDKGWKFAPGGYLQTTLHGTQIRLIDQDDNGRFDDVGKDAMIVGSGDVATYYSEVVAVGNRLYSLRLDPTTLTATPFDGPTGKLHLTCTTKGKVLAAVVRSADLRYSFDMAKAADGMPVPVGAYTLVTGKLGLGESRVAMQTGKSKPILVPKDETRQVCWGGPIRAEFEYQRLGDKVHLAPDKVWLYGAAGELYTGWVPLGASPKFTILDDTTHKEVAQAHFPGSC